MPVIVYCQDRSGADELRKEFLAAHFAYIETILERIAVAGPMRDRSGGHIMGSCFIYHTDDEAEARELLENDPYYTAGIYDQIECHQFLGAAGTWVGGKIW